MCWWVSILGYEIICWKVPSLSYGDRQVLVIRKDIFFSFTLTQLWCVISLKKMLSGYIALILNYACWTLPAHSGSGVSRLRLCCYFRRHIPMDSSLWNGGLCKDSIHQGAQGKQWSGLSKDEIIDQDYLKIVLPSHFQIKLNAGWSVGHQQEGY